MRLVDALGDGFGPWLELHTGPAQTSSIGYRFLHPYRTSMRTSRQILESLLDIEQYGDVQCADRTQRLGDLAKAGVVVKDGDNIGMARLGREALAEWRNTGADAADEGYERARAVTLSRIGCDHSEFYREMRRFWDTLRLLRPPAAWFDDPFALILVTYLDQTDKDGYNPFRVLVELGEPAWGREKEWRDLAEQVDPPDEWSVSRLRAMLNRVDDWVSRPAGPGGFCRAMETLAIAERTEDRGGERLSGALAHLVA